MNHIMFGMLNELLKNMDVGEVHVHLKLGWGWRVGGVGKGIERKKNIQQ
jgi:hypothetical protein